jgi:5-formyltetrahydrofolate cyclo-ligase
MSDGGPLAHRKRELRARALRRRADTPSPPGAADALARGVLATAPRARRVAAYASFGTEPPTSALLHALHDSGAHVLLPLLLPDRDLDWCAWSPDGTGPALGVDAVGTCDLVVVPALAVDRLGTRLGRGGGSYDRALARVPAHVLTVALLHDDGEVVDALPCDRHDVPVRAFTTPERGTVRL